MRYQSGKLVKPDVLLDRFGNGYRILILSCGIHPCAYVGVPSDHPLAGFSYMDLLHLIDCHGGLTFSDEGDGEARPRGYFWYGWDYAHAGDYTGCLGMRQRKNGQLMRYVKKPNMLLSSLGS